AAAALAAHASGPLVLVCPHPGDVDEMVDDIALFSTAACDRFPATETTSADRTRADEEFGDRLRVIKRLATGRAAPILVTSIQALVQPVPDRETLAARTRTLRRGEELDLDELTRWL